MLMYAGGASPGDAGDVHVAAGDKTPCGPSGPVCRRARTVLPAGPSS